MFGLLRISLVMLAISGLLAGYTAQAATPDKKESQQAKQAERQAKDERGDKDLPVITLTSPQLNSVNLYPAAFNVEASVTWPGRAGEHQDKREGVEVEFLADGKKFADTEHPPYRVSYLPAQAGIHTLTARIRYGEGKRTIESAPITVISDVLPAISLTAPANNTVLTAPADFSFTASATAPIGSIAKVEYYNGTTLIGTATSAPYTLNWNAIPFGTYSITAKATDNWGISNTSAAITVISNAAPTVSLTAPAANTVMTAPATFTLTANATDVDGSIAKVDYYANGTLIGSATAAPYSYTWSNVAAGSYSITAKATDNYGATTTSSAVAVISNAAPTVSLTAPATNTVVAAPGSFTLAATAVDSDGSIAKVEFYANDGITNTLVGTVTAAPYSFTWSNVAAGTYSLTAKATDNYGAATTSSAVNVISDTPPTISLTSPTANAVSTTPGSFTLTAAATSAMSTIAKVEFYNGTTLLGTVTSAPYTYTWSNVAAGSYSLTAKATDAYGISNTSAGVAVISNQAPTVNLTAPANNASYTTPTAITLSATAADSDGTIARVEFYASEANNSSILIGTATAAPYSVIWNNAAVGSYRLTAVATDNYGAATTSTVASITVIAPPVVSLTSPAANTVATAPGSFTLTANATSAGSIAKVEFHATDANNIHTLIGTATAAPYSYTWANVAPGSYTITAVATDGNGASTTSSAVAVISNAAPTVSLTSPAANSITAAPGSFTLAATAADSDGTIAKVEFYANDGTTNTLVGTATAAPYSYTWSNVAAGSYSITAKATDNYGAVTTSGAVSIISDTPPTISLTSPTANAVSTTPGSFTLTAAATSAMSTIAKVEFYANDGTANTLIGTATAAPYSFSWTNVPVGSYSLTAKATDAYGISNLSGVVSVRVNPGVAQVYYIHPDHLDTPRVITDTSGNIVWTWENQDPFGNNMPNENPSGLGTFEQPLRHPGQVADKETGLFQNYFRDYDPATGRYKQFDLIGLRGGINGYVYVGGNPISKIDPTGLIEWKGTGTSAGILANGEARYTLTSECVDGYQMEVVVSVTYASVGGGASLTTSSASFTDKFNYINPYVFDGPAFNVSAGIAAKWGTGFDLTTLGGAESPGGWSAQQGAGLWAGVSFGSSKVVSSKSIACSCPTK